MPYNFIEASDSFGVPYKLYENYKMSVIFRILKNNLAIFSYIEK